MWLTIWNDMFVGCSSSPPIVALVRYATMVTEQIINVNAIRIKAIAWPYGLFLTQRWRYVTRIAPPTIPATKVAKAFANNVVQKL